MPKKDDELEESGGMNVWYKRLLVAGGIAGALSAVGVGIKQWDDWGLPRFAGIGECKALDAVVRQEALDATAAVKAAQDEVAKKVLELAQQSIETRSAVLNQRLISLGTEIYQNDLAIQGYRDKGEPIPDFYIERSLKLEQDRQATKQEIDLILNQTVTQ